MIRLSLTDDILIYRVNGMSWSFRVNRRLRELHTFSRAAVLETGTEPWSNEMYMSGTKPVLWKNFSDGVLTS
jgi:hypothetical protein